MTKSWNSAYRRMSYANATIDYIEKMAESDPAKALSHLKWSAWNGIYDAIAGYYGAKKVEELIEKCKNMVDKANNL